jgi:hypothetical protein
MKVIIIPREVQKRVVLQCIRISHPCTMYSPLGFVSNFCYNSIRLRNILTQETNISRGFIQNHSTKSNDTKFSIGIKKNRYTYSFFEKRLITFITFPPAALAYVIL